MSTYDQMAIGILLSNGSKKSKQAQLSKLRAHASGRVECHECGDEGPHEDNGCSGAGKTCLCSCGCQFEIEV
jgi:hypothetical protein